jgi:hypothetical protein
MKNNQREIDRTDLPGFANSYGSNKDWEEIVLIAKEYGQDLSSDQAREVMYFIRRLADLIVETLEA